jgi:hypothetical protein
MPETNFAAQDVREVIESNKDNEYQLRLEHHRRTGQTHSLYIGNTIISSTRKFCCII